MRSMQIMSSVPMPIMSRLTPIAKQAPIANVEQETVPTSGWKAVPLASLPTIYCLERTHIHVDDSHSNVADRISECMRKESILAVFHKDENLIDAETSDGIQFSIRLWEGKNGAVLVEAQKVSGCCYSYCQAAKAILRAAKGIRAPPKRRTFSIPPSVPRVSAEEAEAATRDGLELAKGLWMKQQLDSQLLAIESLMHLSRATENQCFTAKCILSGEFRGKLLNLIESFSTDSNRSEIEEEYMTIMRRHAFTILSNCFAALERSGELSSLLRQQADLTSDAVVEGLVGELASAAERPHDACQAAHCLRSLLAASVDMQRKAAELNAIETISAVRLIGACRHASLEDACTQLRTLL